LPNHYDTKTTNGSEWMSMIMQTNPELAQRMGLMQTAPDPGVLGRRQPQQQQQQQGGTGVGGALNRLLSGGSERDNSALMQAGLAGLAANSQGGSALDSMVAMAQGGQAQGLQNRQQAQMQQSLQSPDGLQQAFNQALMDGNAPMASAIGNLIQNNQTTSRPHVVDGQLVASDGSVLLPALPEGADLTQSMQDVLFLLGTDPESATPAQLDEARNLLMEMKQSGANRTSINNIPVDAATAMQNTMTTKMNADLASAVDDEEKARESMGVLSLLDNLLETTPTGLLESALLPFRQFGISLGIGNADRIGQQELFDAFGKKLALANRTDLPGPMSNSDRKFLMDIVPTLSKTPGGNRVLIQVLMRFEQRKIDLSVLMDEYADARGTTTGFRAFRRDWIKDNPMDFSDLYAPDPFGQE